MIGSSAPTDRTVGGSSGGFSTETNHHLGHGAYFADNPAKSHAYTVVDPPHNSRIMFYAKVLLGKSSILTAPNNKLIAAPRNYHSVAGQHNPMTEYIVYRYGQALPYLKIVYTV